MQNYFPKIVDPWELTVARGYLQGEIPLQVMPRLRSLLNASHGKVVVSLQAGIDEQNIHFFIGYLQTSVEMVCQRCMNPLRLPMRVNFRLGLVHAEAQVGDLPEGYESLLVPQDGLLAMSEWVEDELILALPLVPRHDDMHECEALGLVFPGKTLRSLEGKTNPFVSLSTLLNKKGED
jgi:uncharacterized protein